MDLQLNGRRAPVTGASQGIGILVNSAGGSQPIAFDATKEQWHEGMRLNFRRIRSEQRDKRYPTDEAQREFSEAEISAGCFGQQEEIGDLAIFLASPLAGCIAGAVIPVDVGMSGSLFDSSTGFCREWCAARVNHP